MMNLTKLIDGEWLVAIRDWAESHPLIEEAYIFGSRIKGSATNSSDLDVAVLIGGSTQRERDANWICTAGTMRDSLAPKLPVALDLWSIGEDDEIVGPAVKDHGLLVFKRESKL